MMTDDITELVDEPAVIESDYDVSLSRWQKYGHDRLYVNGFETEPYVDLEEGMLGDTGHVALKMERDGDTITLWRKGKRDEREVVISLSGDVPHEGGEEPAEDDGSADGGSEATTNGAEPTPEHVAEVGYHTAAGQAQQIEAQRLFADDGGD